MTFTMYPLGDTAFIERVLNGVAMYSGSGQIGSAVAVASLLGVIVAAVQGVFNGGREIAFGPILLGIVLYMMMFETGGVTVVMQDQTTGAVRVVDNVPMGVALPAYVFSSIGKGLTEGFETAYATLTTDGVHGMGSGFGFSSSLKTLMNIRQTGLSQNFYNAANQVMNGNFQKTMQDYLQNCTLNYYEANPGQRSNLVNQPVMDAIKSTNPNIYTPYYLNTGETNYSCPAAYSALSTVIGELWANPGVNSALNTILNVQDLPGGQSVNDPLWQQKINYATQDLGILGNTATSAQQYVETSIIWPILHSAIGAKYNSDQDKAMAMIMNNEWDKRLLSWNAQYTFFSATIKPLMTFFEGLVYGITPFVAILLVMGGFGIRLAMKYFMIIIWVQLWMPMLAICNLFIVHGAHDQMLSALTNNAANAHASFYLLTTASEVAKTWLGIGSYMGTSVPMIAMFIVSGSFYGMSSLANAISASSKQAADTVADQAQPDAFNMGAMESQQAMFNGGFQGGTASGGSGLMKGVTLGNVMSTSIQAGKQELSQQSEAFSNQLRHGLSNFTSSGHGTAVAQTVADSASFSHSKVSSVANKITSGIEGSNSWTASQRKTVQGLVAMGLSGSIGMPELAKAIDGLDIQAGAKGSAQSSTSHDLGSQISNQVKQAQSGEITKQDQAQFMRQVASGWNKAAKTDFSSGAQSNEVSDISNSASELASTSESYQEMEASQGTTQAGMTITPFNMADPNSGAYVSDGQVQKLSALADQAGVNYRPLEENMMRASGGNQAASIRGALVQSLMNADPTKAKDPAALRAAQMYTGKVLGQASGLNAQSGPQARNVGGVSTGNLLSGSQINRAGSGMTAPSNNTGTPGAIRWQSAVDKFAKQTTLSGGGWDSVKNSEFQQYQQRLAQAAQSSPGAAYKIFGAAGLVEDGAKYYGGSVASGADATMHEAKSFAGKLEDDAKGLGHAVGGVFSHGFGSIMGQGNQLVHDVGGAFSQSFSAGVTAYKHAEGQIFNQMVQSGEGHGLSHLQAQYYAAETMSKFDDLLSVMPGGAAANIADHISMATGNGSMFHARNQAEQYRQELKATYGDKLGGNMAQVIGNAAGNDTFASSQLAPLVGLNNAMRSVAMPSGASMVSGH